MITNAKQVCDLCGFETLSPVYHPLQSRYAVEVSLCKNCQLVQSKKYSNPVETVKTTSSDADWGNVRHGKGLRFDVLQTKFDLLKLVKGLVLDVGSNRGDFVNWANALNGVERVVAIEPDNTILSGYDKELLIHQAKVEDVDFHQERFDFIYCCQTLEHADSAFQMLSIIRELMQKGGKALIDIPNVEVINKTDIIEEFFIDKHTFHFSPATIAQYFAKLGLNVCEVHEDQYNMSYLVERCEPYKYALPTSGDISWQDIKKYSTNLIDNRSNLHRLVQLRMAPLIKRQKCAIWGAGRTLDALIKFGGLAIDDKLTIVDTYLYNKIDILNEYKIRKPSYLKLVEPQVVFILANSAEDKLAEQAYRMGIRHVIKFSEMMDQT